MKVRVKRKRKPLQKRRREPEGDVTKLPKWAQRHIEDLHRERDAAIDSLDKFVFKDKPTPFSFEDGPCTGETSGPVNRTKYIDTTEVEVDYGGVRLSVHIRPWDSDGAIHVKWGGSKHIALLDEVAFVPEAYQSARIVSKANMR